MMCDGTDRPVPSPKGTRELELEAHADLTGPWRRARRVGRQTQEVWRCLVPARIGKVHPIGQVENLAEHHESPRAGTDLVGDARIGLEESRTVGAIALALEVH